MIMHNIYTHMFTHILSNICHAFYAGNIKHFTVTLAHQSHDSVFIKMNAWSKQQGLSRLKPKYVWPDLRQILNLLQDSFPVGWER